jgi:hypothetical protein
MHDGVDLPKCWSSVASCTSMPGMYVDPHAEMKRRSEKKGEIFSMEKQRIFLAIMNLSCVRAARDSVNIRRIHTPV